MKVKNRRIVDMNMSIRCEVTECKYNNGNEHYCMLNKIAVVRNSAVENGIEHTDCGCFESK